MTEETTSVRPFSADSFNRYIAEHRLMAARCTQCILLAGLACRQMACMGMAETRKGQAGA
jgi:hypothetical protein